MLARTVTQALVGLEARRVEVEANVHGGLPGFTIVGLADRACQEAKERVKSGIFSAQLEWPLQRRVTVNLAPAGLRKEGSGFDLAIALAILAATRQVDPDVLGATLPSASSRSTATRLSPTCAAKGSRLRTDRRPTGARRSFRFRISPTSAGR